MTLLSPLCLSRSQNMVFHKRWASPPLPPIIYSSLVRHLPKTNSTKCPITCPGTNNRVDISNRAWLQSTTIQCICPPSPDSAPYEQLRLKVHRCTEKAGWRGKKTRDKARRVKASCYQISAHVLGSMCWWVSHDTAWINNRERLASIGGQPTLLHSAGFIQKMWKWTHNVWWNTHIIQ